jgi:hypothetical protein
MPIYPLLQNSALTPEHIRAMGTAFEAALAKLGMVNRDDPIVHLVARKVIEVAQRGEQNPVRLCELTVMHFARDTVPTSTEEAKPVDALPSISAAVDRASLAELLEVLVRDTIEHTGGKARAAFYLADDDNKLHHIIGMTQAYAQRVDGFAIGPQSLACGLAAAMRESVITPDVIGEARWEPWLWLSEEFDYRACWSLPVETSMGMIVGTFAMYFKDPTEATPRDLDFAATLSRTAASIISRNAPRAA